MFTSYFLHGEQYSHYVQLETLLNRRGVSNLLSADPHLVFLSLYSNRLNSQTKILFHGNPLLIVSAEIRF